MKYRSLGNSGTAVSKLGLGTMTFGNEASEAESFRMLDTFLEAGGNLVDTADAYGSGKAEQIIGRWLKDRPIDLTDRVVLATKGRTPSGSDVNDVGLSRRHLQRALDASLKRLGVERVDLYQLHAADMTTPVEETLGFMEDAIRAGKIHYYGLSNCTGWQIQLFVSTAKAMGSRGPVTIQPQYSLLSRETEWEIVQAAIYNGIGILPWSPLAGGFLTGKYKRGTTPPADTRSGSDSNLYRWTSEEYAESDQNWDVISAVVDIAEKIGSTPAQVALSWITNRPGVTSSIMGARNTSHLLENLGAAALELDHWNTQALEDISAPKPGGYPYGAFGRGQRAREITDGNPVVQQPYAKGSEHPLGKPIIND